MTGTNDNVLHTRAAIAAGAAALTVCAVACQINKRRSLRLVPKYTRNALLRPIAGLNSTPWKRILTYGTAADFIVTINITKSVLVEHLLPLFDIERPRVNKGGPYRRTESPRGRRPQLESIDLLGLALFYLKSCDSVYRACPIFGIVPSSVYVWLDYSLQVLERVVKRSDEVDFAIVWPDKEAKRKSAALLQRNRRLGPLLSGVFAIMDGFTQAVEVTNLFVWSFEGMIIHAAVNYPGSWHDSKLAAASGLYFPKLSDSMTEPGFAILADSAFPRTERTFYGKIVRARKTNEMGTTATTSSAWGAAIELLLDRTLPSERQSAEWGIRAMKGPFERLTVPLPTNSRKRF
eukprot:IDg1424t1